MLDTERLYSMARRLVYERALHEGPDELAKDLIQAGWVKYLQLKSHAHLWKDIEYAMLEEISRWIWSCKRGRGKNRLLTIKLQFNEMALDGYGYRYPSPEQVLIWKEEFNGLPVARKRVSKKHRTPAPGLLG